MLALTALILAWSWQPVLAQGDTGPPGLQALPHALVMLTVFPYAGLVLSYLLFRAFGRAWMFFLAPFFYVGISFLIPFDPSSAEEPAPPLFSAPGAWFYWPHFVGVAAAYFGYRKYGKAAFFFLAPVLAWAIQIVSLMILVAVY